MKNFLITGSRQIGKSTLVRRLTGRLQLPVSGYVTVPEERYEAGSTYRMKALESREQAPISRYENGRFIGVEETFLDLGVRCLKQAAVSSAAIVIMDEIGRFEQQCQPFITQIHQVLGSDKLVLAAVKKEEIPFIAALKQRQDCMVLDLDEISQEEAETEILGQMVQHLWKASPAGQPAKMRWDQNQLHYHLTLRLYQDGKSFGPGPMKLLQGIEQYGSLQKSAAQMGMAYSKAWKIIRHIEVEWGFPMTAKHTGGADGGGSVLTQEGKWLLQRYEALLRETQQAAGQAFQKYFL